METIINNTILRATGKTPEGLDKEVISSIVKDAAVPTDALVNLIMTITGKDRWDRDARWAARDIAVSIIMDFKKDPELSWDLTALAVISSYFANPKLVTVAVLKIMMNKTEKAI